jgi:hypothetical protein
MSATLPYEPSDGLERLRYRLNKWIQQNTPFMVPIIHAIKYGMTNEQNVPLEPAPRKQFFLETEDDLKPGDLVEIRSDEEIRSTLNDENKFKGLGVMPEMRRFYGNKYHVFKKINRILIEETGELRTIKSPTYILEGVFCNGEFHMDCDRSCFLLWKREWLKKL